MAAALGTKNVSGRGRPVNQLTLGCWCHALRTRCPIERVVSGDFRVASALPLKRAREIPTLVYPTRVRFLLETRVRNCVQPASGSRQP